MYKLSYSHWYFYMSLLYCALEQLREDEQKEMYKIEELRDQVKQVEFETGEVTKQKQTLETSIKQMVHFYKFLFIGIFLMVICVLKVNTF